MNSPDANVVRFLLDGREPDRDCLILAGERRTYGELQQAVLKVAGYCAALGLEKGTRVVLAGENSFFWVAAYLGVMRAGMVCVPVPPGVLTADLGYIVRRTEAQLAFMESGFARRHTDELRGLHVVTDRAMPPFAADRSQSDFGSVLAAECASGGTLPSVTKDDLAALMFTSGSTGVPRGVMVTHGNIAANAGSITEYLGLRETDRMMVVLPFHYCYGASLLHTHLRVGGSLVIDLRFRYPEAVLQRMIELECTGFAGVPSHFQILLRSAGLRKKSFPHLRHVQQAGGHLAPAFVRELRDALPKTSVFIMYGQTEATARLSYLPPECLDSKLGSIGKGIPGVKLSVLNEAGLPVQAGEVGEIVAEGANVTAGYWHAPEETAATFRNGKLHTGDLATLDKDGFIYVVDRAKDFLKIGGERVSCRKVEDLLLGFEETVEAAVVGLPDVILGEAVKAYVVPRDPDPNGFLDRFTNFCRGAMPPNLIPREIVVKAALSKNDSGKVIKRALKG
jgi:long-chain acyl-CoA synthetase